jgi:hypothetical protein
MHGIQHWIVPYNCGSAKHHTKIVVCKGDDLFEGETCQQSKDSVGAEYAAMENKT